MNPSVNHWIALAAGDLSARDALIRENLSLVHHVAQQRARSLSSEMQIDELVSAGTLGGYTSIDVAPGETVSARIVIQPPPAQQVAGQE